MMITKSKINSPEWKEKVHHAIDKALEAMAYQHEANCIEDIEQDPISPYCDTNPDWLGIALTFRFNYYDQNKKQGTIVCQPFLDFPEE